MIDLYKKYYLEEDTIQKLLSEAVVIFDTSALLDLYYYSDQTRKEIFDKVFVFLKNRLWIPAQVYFEFLKNKSQVSGKPIAAYKNLLSKGDKTKDGGYIDKIIEISRDIQEKSLKNIKGQLVTLKENTSKEDKHPFFESGIYSDFDRELGEFEEKVKIYLSQTLNFREQFSIMVDKKINELKQVDEEEIENAINLHFQIGKEYSYSEMIKIAEEGAFRYKEQIPPGYEDDGNKNGLQKYGDLFAWKQILEYTKVNKKDCILVINDVKEDWFENDKKTPRYELLREFNSTANKFIWLMPMSGFLYKINNLLDSHLAEDTIDDVQNVYENKLIQELNEKKIIDIVQDNISEIYGDDINLTEKIPINESVRVFDNPILISAENSQEDKCKVVINFLKSGIYARTLHALSNADVIKKFYERNGEKYKFYNIVLFDNELLIDKISEHLEKKNIRKYLRKREIQLVICYLNNERLMKIEVE